MITYEGLDKNFQFLVLEVTRQLETTLELLDNPSERLLRMILSRDNYTDTLKALIEKKCIAYYRHARDMDKSTANLVTAINVCSTNLERIADFCVNIAGHVRQLDDFKLLAKFRYQTYLEKLITAMPQVGASIESVNASTAIRLCRVEDQLDEIYAQDYDDIRADLRIGENTDDLLICLNIAHYLERMGDSMLNIGEAILFAATGEKLKLHEFDQLSESLKTDESNIKDYRIDFQWETRSGCRIAKVRDASGHHQEMEAVFKKGHAEKLRKERANIQRWEKVFPGLPPRILDFRDGEDDASLLLQFLEGYTLRDLVLSGETGAVDEALECVEGMLRTIWAATTQPEPINARFVEQLADRVDEVFRLHPEFVNACFEVGTMSFPSLEELLAEGKLVENELCAPFTVLVHGDLNADNIIYDKRAHRMHLIDLYRSKESDYVQDVSTLLVSNFRLPVLEGDIRETLNHVILRLYRSAKSFAEEHNDDTFVPRLALGLARGLITSTRFEFDEEFAKSMYTRAVYLLEKVIAWVRRPTGRLPDVSELLVY